LFTYGSLKVDTNLLITIYTTMNAYTSTYKMCVIHLYKSVLYNNFKIRTVVLNFKLVENIKLSIGPNFAKSTKLLSLFLF